MGDQNPFDGDYHDSPIQVLLSVYPEHDWVLEKFKKQTSWILEEQGQSQEVLRSSKKNWGTNL